MKPGRLAKHDPATCAGTYALVLRDLEAGHNPNALNHIRAIADVLGVSVRRGA